MRRQINSGLAPWLILALGAALAFGLFAYAASAPIADRVNGDIIGYLAITARFRCLGDAFSFVGDRTYGFPLFIYVAFLSRWLVGASELVPWLVWVCCSLFLFHLAACLAFHFFFLRGKFAKAGLPALAAAIATAMIMAFPALVAHTATPLTDTFCVDLLMVAAALHAASRDSIRAFALGQSALCGLILGYAVMVRPSFWPAIVGFYGASFLEALAGFSKQRRRLLLSAFMAAGSLALILPALEAGRNAYKTPCLQNPAFVKAVSGACIQSGLSSVRVFWSTKLASKDPLPGIKDPYLFKTFGTKTEVNSLGSLLACLLSKPLAVPVYFAKKTIALFDQPFLLPYAIDQNPNWFPPLQRLFEVPAFCGFAALIFWAISRGFLNAKEESIGAPWAAFVAVLLLTHLVMHIEGRYGLPAVPFSISSLFLGFAGARQAGGKVLLLWLATMAVAGAIFLFQVTAWDSVIPS